MVTYFGQNCENGGAISTADVTEAAVVIDGTDYTVYTLSVTLTDAVQASGGNIYALSGTPASQLTVPAAYHAAAADGGTNSGDVMTPYYCMPDGTVGPYPNSEHDSWLTIGVTDGTAGVLFNTYPFGDTLAASASWTSDNTVLAYSTPDDGPGGAAAIVVGQITRLTSDPDATVTMNLHGRVTVRTGSMDQGVAVPDWVQPVSFSLLRP